RLASLRDGQRLARFLEVRGAHLARHVQPNLAGHVRAGDHERVRGVHRGQLAPGCQPALLLLSLWPAPRTRPAHRVVLSRCESFGEAVELRERSYRDVSAGVLWRCTTSWVGTAALLLRCHGLYFTTPCPIAPRSASTKRWLTKGYVPASGNSASTNPPC